MLYNAYACHVQETPDEWKSELVSYNKIMGRTTMLDGDLPENADGEGVDTEDNGGYECCWKAPNPALAR